MNSTSIAYLTNQIPSLNSKYSSAWAEINTRIAQRQLIINFYTTFFLAAISTGLITKYPDLFRVLYTIPPLSVLFIYLIEMHEIQIAISRSFLSEIEECKEIIFGKIYKNDKNDSDENIVFFTPLFYHEKSPRLILADKIRKIHDFVCIGLVLGTNCISFILSFYIIYFKTSPNPKINNICEPSYGSLINLSPCTEIIIFSIEGLIVLFAVYRALNIKKKRELYFRLSRENTFASKIV